MEGGCDVGLGIHTHVCGRQLPWKVSDFSMHRMTTSDGCLDGAGNKLPLLAAASAALALASAVLFLAGFSNVSQQFTPR